MYHLVKTLSITLHVEVVLVLVGRRKKMKKIEIRDSVFEEVNPEWRQKQEKH